MDSISILLTYANDESLNLNDRLNNGREALHLSSGLQNDSVKRSFQFKVANSYFNNHSFNQYKRLSETILAESAVSLDTFSMAKANNYLADYFMQTVNKDSALYYYIKAEKLYNFLNNYTRLVDVCIAKSCVLFENREYYGSEMAALNALRYLKNVDDKSKELEAYNLLGINASELYNYPTALIYLQRALNISDEQDLVDNQQRAYVLNNIGTVYGHLNKYDLAMKYFGQAFKIVDIEKNLQLYAVLLDNWAYAKFKRGFRNDEVLNGFLKSLKIKRQLGHVPGSIFTESRLAEYYFFTGDTIGAVKLLKHAITLDGQHNSIDLVGPLQQLILYDPAYASESARRLSRITDSLERSERLIKDRFARIRFETNEISEAKDKAVHQKSLILGIATLSLVSISLLFIIVFQRSRTKQLQLVQEQQRSNAEIYRLMLDQQSSIDEARQSEKKRISRDLHDSVMNMLTSIRLNLFVLHKKNDSETIQKCLPFIDRIQTVEKEIHNISHNLTSEVFDNRESFSAVLELLFEHQERDFSTICKVNIDRDTQWEKIDMVVKVHLYRIVQELLQNINKHSSATEIEFTIHDQPKMIAIQISDNGIGFNPSTANSGIGIKNIRQRATLINGEVEYTSKRGHGTKIKLLVPK